MTTPTRTLEVQSTFAEFLSHLPGACGNLPFEVIDNEIVVYDEDEREVHIIVHDGPLRRLGSLALPMESVRLDFEDHTEDDADAFMARWRAHSMPAGGGLPDRPEQGDGHPPQREAAMDPADGGTTTR